MSDKIHRTIAGKYVSLKPGDTTTPGSQNCTGCVFFQNIEACVEALEHKEPAKRGYNLGISYCQHHIGVWREEKVEVNKSPRRKLI